MGAGAFAMSGVMRGGAAAPHNPRRAHASALTGFLLTLLLHAFVLAVVILMPERHAGTGAIETIVSARIYPLARPAPQSPKKIERKKQTVQPKPQPVKPVTTPPPAKPVPQPAATAPVAHPPVVPDANATRAQGRADYAGKIWAAIAAHKPRGIRLDGTAIVYFAIDANGALLGAHVAQSSGNAKLDTLALQTVESAAPYPKPPAVLEADDLRFTIPFAFR